MHPHNMEILHNTVERRSIKEWKQYDLAESKETEVS